MDKPRPFIHWESSYDYVMGVLVIGRFRLPVFVPAILSGIYLVVTLIGAGTVDSTDGNGLADGLAWFILNLLIVGSIWGIVGAVVGGMYLWRIIQSENDWRDR